MDVANAADIVAWAVTEVNGEEEIAKVLAANVDVLEEFDAAVALVDSKTFKYLSLIVARML